MRRRWLAVAVGVLLAGGLLAAPAAADRTVHLVVNGVELNPSVPPQIIGGSAMVPVRAVAEALGATVGWDAATRTVRVSAATPGGIDIPALVRSLRPSIVGVVALAHDASGNPVSASTGSGVILTADGIVVTNAHVVTPSEFAPDTWYVEFSDGRTVQVPQGSIFADPLSDLAFIKTGATGLRAAPLGDSSRAVVGQPVITIGNPLGYSLRDTVTRGIISGVGRYLPGGQFYYPFLQTDAAINPGNSGGALIDAQGDVIGITSVKLAAAKIQGLGFAIPANTVRDIFKQYQAVGQVVRPWLGVSLSEPWQATYGLPTADGLTVTSVTAGSPAAQAGLQQGDQILALNGQAVHTVDGLIALLWSHAVGDTVSFTVSRGGAQTQVQVVLAARPANLTAARGGPTGAPALP